MYVGGIKALKSARIESVFWLQKQNVFQLEAREEATIPYFFGSFNGDLVMAS